VVNPERLARTFESAFGRPPKLYRAPGRINLIGEHTDYNDGFVMPIALDRATWIAGASRADCRIVARSLAHGERSVDLRASVPRQTGSWSDYVFGVAALLDREDGIEGADLLIDSDVPEGAGLSSSAALEVATGLALLDLSGRPIDSLRLARISQQAEHQFVGTRCGLMDQFIAAHGRPGHALVLDTRTLAAEWVPIPRAIRVMACNTMVRHDLATSEYNARRADCEEAVRIISRRAPAIRALRDVTPELLEEAAGDLPDRVYRRARHVVTENERVQRAAAALSASDLQRFGGLMAESHRSLRDDYEVSCVELDVMVDAAVHTEGVHGARMTGGGFGGCAVALVDEAAAEEAARSIQEDYRARVGVHPDVWLCEAGPGAGVVSLEGARR
jgi:galactokinase